MSYDTCSLENYDGFACPQCSRFEDCDRHRQQGCFCEWFRYKALDELFEALSRLFEDGPDRHVNADDDEWLECDPEEWAGAEEAFRKVERDVTPRSGPETT